MKRALIWLWLGGGMLYAICTLLFADAVNLLGGAEQARAPVVSSLGTAPSQGPQEPKSKVAQSSSPENKPAHPLTDVKPPSKNAPGGNAPATQSASSTPEPQVLPGQSIVEQPITEDAQPLAQPDELAVDGVLPAQVLAASKQQAREVPEQHAAEDVVVASAVNMRTGPSTSAQTIGVAQAGTKLRIAAQDSGWVQVINPVTQETGWIYSGFLAPSPAIQAPPTGAAKLKPVAEGAPSKTKPAGQDREDKSPPPDEKRAEDVASPEAPEPPAEPEFQREYADLPPGESVAEDEYLPPRRRGPLGFFARGRLQGGPTWQDFPPPPPEEIW
jgi:hypothetical protein